MVVLPQDTRGGAALEKHSESGEQVCGAGDERERHSSIALLPLMLDRPVEEPGQSTALGQAYRQVALRSVCLASQDLEERLSFPRALAYTIAY